MPERGVETARPGLRNAIPGPGAEGRKAGHSELAGT